MGTLYTTTGLWYEPEHEPETDAPNIVGPDGQTYNVVQHVPEGSQYLYTRGRYSFYVNGRDTLAVDRWRAITDKAPEQTETVPAQEAEGLL